MSKRNINKVGPQFKKVDVPVDVLGAKTARGWKGDLLPLLGILAVSFVVFIPTLSADFVYWDDDRYVLDNTLLQPLSWKTVRNIFTTPVSNSYNPLVILSLAVDKQLFGLNASYYHWHNVFLHLVCTGLVFWWMRLLPISRMGAVIIAVLFGIHTMRVESVAWVTERKDLIFGIWFVAAGIAYMYFIRAKSLSIGRWKYYLIALIFIFVSLLSKIQAVSFPLAMLTIDYLMGRTDVKGKNFIQKWIPLVVEKIPFFLLSLGIGVVGVHFLGDTIETGKLYPFWQRLFFAPYTLSVYLCKFFVPVVLSALHPYPAPSDYLPVKYFLSAIPILGLVGLVVWRFRQNKAVVFGLMFFLANVIFLLQVVGGGQAFLADRFTYIAYIGLFFIVAYFYDWVVANKSEWLMGLRLVIGGWVIALCVMTYQRSEIWMNSETLWEDALSQYKFIDVAYYNMGNYLRQKKQILKAEACYNKILEVQPNNYNANLNLGILFFDRNENDKAEVCFQKVVASNPPDIDVKAKGYGNLGGVFFRQNKFGMAESYIDTALKLQPVYPDAYLNRGVTYSVTNQHPKAKADYEKYISYKQDNSRAYLWLGIEYFTIKDYKGAIEQYTKSLAINPNDKEVYGRRAESYLALGNKGAADEDLARAK
jgi:protein O-mannosyl-transferase